MIFNSSACTACVFAGFALFCTIVYRLTARLYYRIVKKQHDLWYTVAMKINALSEKRETEILRRLEEAGFEGYFVGGCVREAIRREMAQTADRKATPDRCGEESCREVITDTDIATDARPEQVKTVFHDMTVLDTGIKHGTVTVLFPTGGLRTPEGSAEDADRESQCGGRIPVEITTYRIDGEYSDGRHPESVQFTSGLEEDLARRDFTVNAIACNRHGELTDPFGGAADIEARIIRAVGDPEQRFREDGLRIMRALRFAAKLGYDIEPGTSEALSVCKGLLADISAERIYSELCRLVTGEGAGEIIRKHTDVLGVVIPELLPMKGFAQNNPYHRYDVLEHCIRTMEAVETREDNIVYMKLAALFHDIGKPETYSEDENGIGHFYGHPSASCRICRDIMNRLHADSFTKDRLCRIVKYHDLVFEKDRRLLKRWMNRFGADVLSDILEVKKADNFATGNMENGLKVKFDEIRAMMEQILDEQQCFSLRDLAVDGRDIIAAGIEPGPEVGLVLKRLLADVIDEKLPNDKDVLMDNILTEN